MQGMPGGNTRWHYIVGGAVAGALFAVIAELSQRPDLPIWALLLIAVLLGATAGLLSLLFVRRRHERAS